MREVDECVLCVYYGFHSGQHLIQCEAFHRAMIGSGSDPHHHHPVSIPDCVISNVVNDEDDELLGGRVTDSVVSRSIMSISK